ncbi:MAG: hypothetical protein NW241_17155 [Bacteroidia bacterium]|nr:hypothetical protein [Bacteroidia bacterium]
MRPVFRHIGSMLLLWALAAWVVPPRLWHACEASHHHAAPVPSGADQLAEAHPDCPVCSEAVAAPALMPAALAFEAPGLLHGPAAAAFRTSIWPARVCTPALRGPPALPAA